jgi:DNA-binding beta-propeller fold protein YncE
MKRWGRWRTNVGAMLAGAAALLPAACDSPPPATFPYTGPAIVWPPPPEAARIRYAGELSGEASLGGRSREDSVLRTMLEGPRQPAGFSTPMAVAVLGSRVYVVDPSHGAGPLVHVLNLETRAYAQIRDAGGARLRWPIDIAAAAGRLALVDARQAAVFVLDSDGRTLATIRDSALTRPAAVAWCAGQLWVVDAAAHGVCVFDANGKPLRQVGVRGSGPGQFNFPAGLAAFDPPASDRAPPFRIAVADAMNFRVQLLAADGSLVRAFGRKGDAAGDFSLPRDVAVDAEGHVYVLDSQFENVQIFDAEGGLLLAFGEEGSGPGRFSVPSGITIDDQQRVWVADTYNRRVQVFQYLPETTE